MAKNQRIAELSNMEEQDPVEYYDIDNENIASYNCIEQPHKPKAISNTIYGKPNLPRQQQPSMFEILSFTEKPKVKKEN